MNSLSRISTLYMEIGSIFHVLVKNREKYH